LHFHGASRHLRRYPGIQTHDYVVLARNAASKSMLSLDDRDALSEVGERRVQVRNAIGVGFSSLIQPANRVAGVRFRVPGAQAKVKMDDEVGARGEMVMNGNRRGKGHGGAGCANRSAP